VERDKGNGDQAVLDMRCSCMFFLPMVFRSQALSVEDTMVSQPISPGLIFSFVISHK